MDLLSNVLTKLKLSGTVYFRASLISPWAIRLPNHDRAARFHFALKGACFVRIDGVPELLHLRQGDLLIIPHGNAHRMFCDPITEDHAVTIDSMIEDSGFDGTGVLVYGGHDPTLETQLLSGHFAFDVHANHTLVQGLPKFIHVKDDDPVAGEWLLNSFRLLGGEAGSNRPGSDIIALKLAEIIFAQGLRSYIASDGAKRAGFAGFSDPNIRCALTAFHNNPAKIWTIEYMANEAGMSRTSFAMRFVKLMAMTPMGYVVQWRMQLARQALADTGLSLIEIAESVGYQSEAAFTRAFKRLFNETPAKFRRSTQMN